MNPKHTAHFGDPCKYCGVAHDEIEPGPCREHLKMKIDRARCNRAMKDIYVSGVPRHAEIEDAIKAIHEDGEGALAAEYIGVKQYAGFGDQRCDCSYGCGPRHGSIVFSIGRTREQRGKSAILGADHIYFLECVRDFGVVDSIHRNSEGRQVKMNLCDVLRRGNMLAEELDALTEMVDATDVSTHERDTPHA